MSQPERRHAERQDASFPVLLNVPEPVSLEGKTVNYSSKGVLLLARGGRIRVVLDVKGKTYRGQLLRAFAQDPDTTAYAIALEEELQEPVNKDQAQSEDPGPTSEDRKGSGAMESFMTAQEAAAYLKVNQRTLYRLLKADRIRGLRVGRQWRFRKSELDAGFQRGKSPAASHHARELASRVE